MKLNKKIIITAAIVAVVAICGIIVYSVGYKPKMLVGGLYNGISLRTVTDHSDMYAEYDIHNALDVEKKIAENTNILISAMTLTADNTGKVTLKIVSPDIKGSLEQLSEKVTLTLTDKDKFKNELADELINMFKTASVSDRSEPVFIEADMKYEAGTWVIIPDRELFSAITGNFAELVDALFPLGCK